MSKGLLHKIPQDLETYMKWVHTPEYGTQSRRLFDSDFLEIFTKSPWWLVLLNLPQVVFLMEPLVHHSAIQAIVVSLAGLLLWSFIEYNVHRWLFHSTPHPKLIWLHFLFHGIHHKEPHDKERLVMPLAVVISFQGIVVPVIWYFFQHVSSWTLFQCLWGSTLLGYVIYDLAHESFHHVAMQTKLLGPCKGFWTFQRKIHLQHHKSLN